MHIGTNVSPMEYVILGIVILISYTLNRIQIKKEKKRIQEEAAAQIMKIQTEAEVKVLEKLSKSRAVTRGLITEQFVPMLNGFPYTLSDCYFLGKPFDYIIYDGMSAYRDGDKDAVVDVIFADVKYSSSNRSPVQNAIKKAIEEGRVKYLDLRVDRTNTLIIHDKDKKDKASDSTESSS